MSHMKKIILKVFYLAATISCKSPNKLRVGDGVEWMVWHSNCKYFNQRLLPDIPNKTLIIVSIDILHHAFLPRSREKLRLHQFSPDILVHWSINYVDKRIPAKDWRDGGCCSDSCMRKGKRLWEWLYRLVGRWT